MNILEKYNIDLESVLQKLPGKNGGSHFSKGQIISSKKGNQFQVVCPFHADSSPSMGISKEKNAYNCFVCSTRVGESKVIDKEKSIGRGTFIQLIKVFYEQVLNKSISNKEIADLCEIPETERGYFISDIRNISNTTPEQKKQIKEQIEKQKDEPDVHYKFSILQEFIKFNDTYIKSRFLKFGDITIERLNQTIKHFLLKTLEDGSIIIPVIKNWYLIGLYVRQLEDGFAKYYNLKTFRKDRVIYNWDFVDKYQDVILVEGPLNAIRLWSLGYENVVSLFGAKPYPEQIQLLNTKKNIYVWFDMDTAGTLGVQELSKKLKKEVNLYSLQVDGKKDVFDFTKEQIQTLFTQYKKVR